MFNSIQRNRFRTTVLAVAIAILPAGALAAGLGKLTVLSPLGQQLRAELDITASREELASLSARIASAETFRQVGIEYVPAVGSVRFALDKRANGQPFLRVSTDRAVNEPFLDMLVELVWSSGRMVREYTVLLDPPETARPPATAPVAAAAEVPAPVAAPVVSTPAAAAPEVKEAPVVAAPEKTPEPALVAKDHGSAKAVVVEAKGVATTAGHTVTRGETLRKIAVETRVEGVNLDQMLVALLRANQAAFDGGNMNRLRVGKILNIPDQEAASSVAPAEAHKVVVSQAEDFNAYRRKLAAAVGAAAPVAEEVPKQATTGKIAPKVEEKAPVAVSAKDKLEVSRAEAARDAKAAKDAKAMQGRITALEEDLVARDRALKEASSRIGDLEKNLGDLKKLAELKSQTIAQLQQQAAKPVPAPEVKKPEPVPPPTVKPAEVPPVKPVEAAKAPEPAVPAVELAKPQEPVPPIAKPAEPPKPVAEVKKPESPPAVPADEGPGFVDENPTLVWGGGGILAVLLGYLGFLALRRKRDGGLPTTSRISEGDLMANSVFGSTGGQAVDTGASIQTDFSQSNLASINADEGVDPVAEADVYMAYGRDAQAEEILLDALKNDPTRHAIHLKLLEIYAVRKSPKQFEALATDLHGQTGGVGPDWEKAATMGRALDAENSLYGSGEGTTEGGPVAADMAATTIIVPPSQAEKLRDAVDLAAQPSAVVPQPEPEKAEEAGGGLDFDLDVGVLSSTEVRAAALAPALDLDIGVPTEHVDMDFDLNETQPLGTHLAAQKPSAPEAGASDLDFHFDLDAAVPETADKTDDFSPNETHLNRAMTETHLDLAGIDLDLGTAATTLKPAPAQPSGDEDDADVATKIELAQAYEEMGDKEGARELLQEVLQEGSTRQRDTARNMLAALGA